MLLLFLGGGLQAQKDQWLLYPTEVDFPAGPSFSAGPVTGGVTPYLCENSVFDESGNLLFYLQHETAGGNIEVYDGSGNNVGAVSAGGGRAMKEIGIAPVPGQCQAYCVFMLTTFPSASMEFAYFEVNVGSNGNVAISTNGYTVAGTHGGNSASLAVSKIVENTVADRDIYVIAAGGYIYQYRMTGSGVALINTYDISDSFSGQGLRSEVELTPCGDKIAWSDGMDVYAYDFSSGTLYEKQTEGQIAGLEFFGCDQLFFSQQGTGILRWQLEGGATTFLPGSADYDRTHLEMTVDNDWMYAVEDSEELGAGLLRRFDPIFLSFVPISQNVPVYSDGSTSTVDAYALPDQIDGEGDGSFYGVPPLVVEEWGINEESLPQTVSGAIGFYNCNPVSLFANYSGIPSSSSIRIVTVDPSSGLPVIGGLLYNGSIDLSSGPVDLRCLANSNACDLFDSHLGDYFLVQVYLADNCTEIRLSGYFRVLGPPQTVTDVGLEIRGNGPVCSASQDITMPCEGSTLSSSVDFTNAVGDITFYQVDIWEVDCATGEEIQQLHAGDVEQVQSGTAFSFNVNVFYNFLANNFVGKCVKISVEVGNPCGSLEDFTYLEFTDDDPLEEDGGGSSAFLRSGSSNTGTAHAFPNPFTNGLTVVYNAPVDQKGELLVFSQNGQRVFRQPIDCVQGNNQYELPLQHLQSGMYYYRIVTASETHNGQVIKQ